MIMMNNVTHYLSAVYNTPWGQKKDATNARTREQLEKNGEFDEPASD